MSLDDYNQQIDARPAPTPEQWDAARRCVLTNAPDLHDDHRHGTTRGYHAGCHDLCCRRAMARYEKEGRLARLSGGRAVPALGYQRRIFALMRLGWTSSDIAAATGWSHRNLVLRVVNGQKGKPTTWLERKTADAIGAMYEKLSMTSPEMTPVRARTKARAIRLRYAPPLAWDDIDDPNETPSFGGVDNDIDPVVVDRLLAGVSIPSSRAEKVEAMRRWMAAGRSQKSLCVIHGWQESRYVERQDGAA